VKKKHFVNAGEQYGDWTVLRKGLFKGHNQHWICKCACGVEKEVMEKHLAVGNSKSCHPCSGKKYSQSKYEGNIRRTGDHRTAWIARKINELFKEQEGKCLVCNLPLPEESSKWVWDHSHETGKGRGLLHRGCNVFIGFIERHPRIIERSLSYLEKK
jgi:Recombination endonuclease VII